jgi:hypothetical protein
MRSRTVAIGIGLAVLVFASGCGENSPSRLAARVLERYRKASGAKPLPASGMIRIRLSRPSGVAAASGQDEILWEPYRYRETVASAGMKTVRGVEFSGQAYYTDQDGVTRVSSDQALRELRTRSYFWRRAWLFADRERAWLALGPADDSTVSLSLRPEGGNPMVLTFSRRDGRLISARSPRFELEFASERSFRDVSDPRVPVEGEIAWVGLPTGTIPRPQIGGWQARFGEPSDGVPYERRAGALIVSATMSGQKIRVAVDGAADGPVVVSTALARRLALAFAPDVFGRSVAGGASFEIGAAAYPSLWVQESSEIPAGADAVAGGCLFREAVVELDPAAVRLRIHDPGRWKIPEAYFRVVIDDDDDRPVAILSQGRKELRLTAASDTGDAALVLAPASAARMGFAGATAAKGLSWGIVHLPELPFTLAREGFSPDWGDDGRLGFPLLLRFHAFVNMPQRWIYVQALGH